MTYTLHSFTDSGEHNGSTYNLYVQGYSQGPFVLDSIHIHGRGNFKGTAVEWDTVASAMVSGHSLARTLIDEG
jgi:hypothetical protein